MFRGEEIKPLLKHLPLAYSTLNRVFTLIPIRQRGNCPPLGDLSFQSNRASPAGRPEASDKRTEWKWVWRRNIPAKGLSLLLGNVKTVPASGEHQPYARHRAACLPPSPG